MIDYKGFIWFGINVSKVGELQEKRNNTPRSGGLELKVESSSGENIGLSL
jgi:hypothetical protein